MNDQSPNTVRIAVVKAQWHANFVDACVDSFTAEVGHKLGSTAEITTLSVPGAFEIPLIAKRLILADRADLVLGCAFVVDGGIYRHDFVSAAVVNGLMTVGLETGRPVLSAVLTPHNFQPSDFHESAFMAHFVTKGKEAAEACAVMLSDASLALR
ncbi:6,7-dimethyl-8-ribityllumazine synthase [Roseovarius sp.]|uniref:6,7-dimethyl-8-ribityllumazine synthase n=1 Tax=Roseovarius sp. TaxID=1486281 RepID=UPI0035177C24